MSRVLRAKKVRERYERHRFEVFAALDPHEVFPPDVLGSSLERLQALRDWFERNDVARDELERWCDRRIVTRVATRVGREDEHHLTVSMATLDTVADPSFVDDRAGASTSPGVILSSRSADRQKAESCPPPGVRDGRERLRRDAAIPEGPGLRIDITDCINELVRPWVIRWMRETSVVRKYTSNEKRLLIVIWSRLCPQLSDRELAAVLGVSPSTVGKHRRDKEMDTPASDRKPASLSEEPVELQPARQHNSGKGVVPIDLCGPAAVSEPFSLEVRRTESNELHPPRTDSKGNKAA